MRPNTPKTQFIVDNAIEGLTPPTLDALMRGDYELEKAKGFLHFQERIDKEMLTHPVITDNPYTKWFAKTNLSMQQVREFIVQFSVFSNQFLVAQLLKMIAADSLEEMHASKEILANEIGVIFNGHRKANSTDEDESDFGGTEGSIEGGSFHFKAAHFEILLKTAKAIGLTFTDLGKRKFGSEETLFFCDELKRLYGSEDYQTSTAASYAVENWAAAGFWGELIQGLTHFKEEEHLSLPLAFFTWHDKIEANHANHTQEELEEFYFNNNVNENNFIHDGNEMLDGVYAFWSGLAKRHRHTH